MYVETVFFEDGFDSGDIIYVQQVKKNPTG